MTGMTRTDPVGGLQAALSRAFESRRDNLVAAYALWAAAGMLGAHRFYLGAYVTGGVQASLALICFPMAAAAATADATTGVKLGLLVQTLVGGWGLTALVLWLVADIFLIPRRAQMRRARHPAARPDAATAASNENADHGAQPGRRAA